MSNPRPLQASRAPSTASVPDPVADAFRRWGYLQANIDPLGRLQPFEHPDLADARALGAAPELERLNSLY